MSQDQNALQPLGGEMTFNQAYRVLQEHARTLRDQTDPNIDNLFQIVTESAAAYKFCKDRCDAVESALEQVLGGDKAHQAGV